MSKATERTDSEAWERWAAFCDAAMVAPDTRLTPDELAMRYTRETGRMIDATAVAKMMPEDTA